MEEKRRHVRLFTPLTVNLVPDIADSKRIRVISRDISESGIKIPRPLPQGNRVSLEIEFYGKEGFLNLDATVAWNKGYNSGLKFDSPSSIHQRRLSGFISKVAR